MRTQRNSDEGDIIVIHTDLICIEDWGQLWLPDRVSSKKLFGITPTSRSYNYK